MTPRRLEELGAHVAERQDEQLDRSAPDMALRQALGRHAERRLAASGRRSPRSALRWWAAAAVLVPSIAFGLRGWLGNADPQAPLRFSVGGRDGILHAWASAPPAQRLSLDFSDGTRFSLAPEARGRVVAVGPRGAEVVIESGHALVEVVPHAGLPAHWQVRTGPFEVQVKGTRFDVGWDPGTEEFSLRLFDGQVNITGCGFGAGLEVRANQQVEASCRRPGFVVRPLESEAEAPSAEPARLEESMTEAPSTVVLDPPAAVAPSSSTSQQAPSHRAPVARRHWLELAQRGQFERAYAAVEPVFEAECARANVEDVMLLGDAARHAGHADRARLAYLAVRRRAPGSPPAAAAAFALGRLGFESDPEGSSRWFELSLVEAPRGPLAQAARDRLLEAAVRIGDGGRTRRLAERYLRESPEGPRAADARAILKRQNPSY